MEHLSTNNSCVIKRWNPEVSVITSELILEGAILSAALILNTLQLITIGSNHLLRTRTHIFISSLAVSDILLSVYGIIRLPILALGQNICVSHSTKKLLETGLHIIFAVNTCSGYMNILIVSGERWLFISRPFLHERLISRRFTFVGVAVAWFSSLLGNLDGFIFSLPNYWTIADFKHMVLFPGIHFVVTTFLCSIYVHLTVITRRQMTAINKTSYLRSRNNVDTGNIQQRDTMKLLRENLRSIRLLVGVFGGFVVLLSPGICYHLYVSFSSGKLEHPHIHEAFKLLTYLHACVNFVIFASLDVKFRRVLVSWLRRATCRRVRFVSEIPDNISGSRMFRRENKVGLIAALNSQPIHQMKNNTRGTE